MRNFVGGLVAVTALSLSSVVVAAPARTYTDSLSYTNVDVGIISTDLNNSSLSGKGPLVRGSLAFNSSAFVFAQLSDIGYDRDVDGFFAAVGVGGHIPITSQFDLVGKIGLAHQKIDTNGGDYSENGYLLSGTIRGFVVPRLEIEGGLRHEHLSDSGNSTNIITEGRYFFTDRIAGGVLVEFGDVTTVGVVGRFTF